MSSSPPPAPSLLSNHVLKLQHILATPISQRSAVLATGYAKKHNTNVSENIIINVPPLTEERRRDLAKQAKAEAEHAKVGIRNARKDANNEVKKLDISDDMKKNVETDIQQLTDTFVKKTEELFGSKETEIMTV